MGSTSTRKALYSGVSMLASPTNGRQDVDAEALSGRTGEPPVEGDADDLHLLAVAHQRSDALGHHRLGLDAAAVARDLDPAAGRDPLLRRELLRDLDEQLGLEHGVDVHVLGPEVEVLGQPVARGGVGEVVGGTEHLHVALEHPGRRVAADARRQRVVDRRLERLVVRRERPVAHHGAGEQARHALRVHDERPDRLLGRHGRPVVGHVQPDPATAVPLDQPLARPPRPALRIGRSPIVEDAPVDRPRPRPLRRQPGVRRVARVAPGHHVAGFGVAAGSRSSSRTRSCRHRSAARSRPPACRRRPAILVGSVGSGTSSRARPLISRAISSAVGLSGRL